MAKKEYKPLLQSDVEYKTVIKKVGEYNLKNTEKWRERAIFFEKHGCYTHFVEGTADWLNFWNEEERRIMEGLWIDDFYVPGLFYFYLNYLPIYQKDLNRYEFPVLYDSDYHTFLCLEHAVFLKLDFAVIKKRQCIDKETFINLPNGVETIENLFLKNYRGEIFSLDENKELCIDKVKDIWVAKKVTEIIRITLAGGKSIECTEDHKINTTEGWKKASELKLKDTLYTITPPFGDISISEQEAIVMGYFFSDGSYSQKNISPKFTNINKLFLDDFEKNLLLWQPNCGITKHIKGNGYDYVITNKEKNKGKENKFKRYLYSQGLCAKNENRIIPEKYMNLDKQSTSTMINRIFSGNGWISLTYNKKSNSHRYEVGIGSMSLTFLHQLAYLLSKFKINCSVKLATTKKSKTPFYKLRIYKTTEVKVFLKNIGIHGKDSGIKIIKKHNNKEKTFSIKKIEKIEKETTTYDLATENTQSFFANGIHVHNSGFSLKFCVPLIRELFFSKGSPNYIATYEETQVLKTWSDILEPYKEHLNEFTAWYRDFAPNKSLNWRVAKETIDNQGRRILQGRKNTLKGLVLSKSPSKGVGGGAKWIFADEAGVNLALEKFLGYVKPMVTYGNIKTGTIIISGAVGELKHLDAGLKDLILKPEANRVYAVKNIWDTDAAYKDKMCGFFVPECWAFPGVEDREGHPDFGKPFIDEHGNSDVERAIEYILYLREQEKEKGLEKYLFMISQAPLNLMECFQYRTEKVFPIDLIGSQITRIESEKNYGTYVDLYRTKEGVVKHKLLDKYSNKPILEHPIEPGMAGKEGLVQIWEFPKEEAPYGLYWAGVDIVRDSESLTSPSVNCIHIYKGVHHLQDEYLSQKIVATYKGRPRDKFDWYEKAIMLMEFFNAEALVENNVNWFIEETIKDKKQYRIAKTPTWLIEQTP